MNQMNARMLLFYTRECVGSNTQTMEVTVTHIRRVCSVCTNPHNHTCTQQDLHTHTYSHLYSTRVQSASCDENTHTLHACKLIKQNCLWRHTCTKPHARTPVLSVGCDKRTNTHTHTQT